jgi:restriction system protein
VKEDHIPEPGTLWGVHMDASVGTDPTDKGYVAIGWSELGDLSRIADNREAFKKAVLDNIVGAKPGSIPVQAGVLYRFLHEVKEGDLVVYPSKVDRMPRRFMNEHRFRWDHAKHSDTQNDTQRENRYCDAECGFIVTL